MPPVRNANGVKYEKDDEHNDEYLCHRRVLMLQIRIGAFTDGGRDLLHFVCSLGILHNLSALIQCENQGDGSADETD